MAGHSHWAGIKHKKGRQDKQRSNLFSKLSREITVAAKLGSKDPSSNPRLRTAIQSAKESNMPKDNIERAIKKSSTEQSSGYQSFRYEGFGPFNVAFIIETLSNNKNRTASSLRTIFTKNDGRLGENGSVSYLFKQLGVIKLDSKLIMEDEIFEFAINKGASDFKKNPDYYEVFTQLKDFYKIKNEFDNKKLKIISSGIEWRPETYIKLNIEQKEQVKKLLKNLDDNEDVQNVFFNCIFE